jgi:hypothetical protein
LIIPFSVIRKLHSHPWILGPSNHLTPDVNTVRLLNFYPKLVTSFSLNVSLLCVMCKRNQMITYNHLIPYLTMGKYREQNNNKNP